jgi:heme exporter protein C
MNILTFLANPARFQQATRIWIPITGVIAAVALIIGTIWALGFTPPDKFQGDSVRIMYVHVPAAIMSQVAYVFMVIASLIGYIWRHQLADFAAREAAPLGLVFTVLALATGSIWGKTTWGVWWDWDARMTSTLVMAFIYAGYMILWRTIENPAQAARIAALFCIIGIINIPIIKFSVEFWESLHQKASIIRADGPSMPAEMLVPLLVMLFAYGMAFTFFVFLRLHTVLNDMRRDATQPKRKVSVATPVSATDSGGA